MQQTGTKTGNLWDLGLFNHTHVLLLNVGYSIRPVVFGSNLLAYHTPKFGEAKKTSGILQYNENTGLHYFRRPPSTSVQAANKFLETKTDKYLELIGLIGNMDD